MPEFKFDNSYARDLSGFYAPWQPEPSEQPELLYLNDSLAKELGLELQAYEKAELAELFVGNRLPAGAEPIAQAYAGHQFGHFNPQLGDGRALLIGEVVDYQKVRRDIAFKGSGRTPFSRNGDGRAAVGPMLREVLVGEAMYALGVPTTRSLAVVATGEPVYREQMLPGAVLTRVAQSHLRIGTFEFFAARDEHERVQQLADYSIARHFPELLQNENRYLEFFRLVSKRQAELVAQWMSLGFIHGVMNTDNISIAGETIDYGPCAFMEAYNPAAVFSSIDHHGRYAYQNQPRIAQWNLARFAETLLPLLAEDQAQAVELASEALESFLPEYQQQWLSRMLAKLGLESDEVHQPQDVELIEVWFELLQAQQVDYTLAWRYLADAAEGRLARLRDLFADHVALDAWLQKWEARCALYPRQNEVRAEAMRQQNPWLIPRNHWVERALEAASDSNDLQLFERLLQALQAPFDERPDYADFAEAASSDFTEAYQTFCGT